MRDRLIHDYFGVDYHIVWDVATNKLPELKRKIVEIIWPNKEEREGFEINKFIESYKKLPSGRSFNVVGRGDLHFAGPDYVVEDAKTGEYFGVELVSVYLNDRSVPEVHMKSAKGMVPIPDDEGEVENYKGRLVQAIREKIEKAISYDKRYPLILSVYVNEYISIYMNREDFESLVRANGGLFDEMRPFSEIVFWSLPDGGVFSVKP
jgi:hypothetical protein